MEDLVACEEHLEHVRGINRGGLNLRREFDDQPKLLFTAQQRDRREGAGFVVEPGKRLDLRQPQFEPGPGIAGRPVVSIVARGSVRSVAAFWHLEHERANAADDLDRGAARELAVDEVSLDRVDAFARGSATIA
jgi:hypothetical protein